MLNSSFSLSFCKSPLRMSLGYTVFHLITAPALITAPPLTFYFIFTYHRPLEDLVPDLLLYFNLLSPT